MAYKFDPVKGECYAASEALYHILGGKAKGWTPVRVEVKGAGHWFLRHSSGVVLDPTVTQFRCRVPYEKGVGCGFQTKEPSGRAKSWMERLGAI